MPSNNYRVVFVRQHNTLTGELKRAYQIQQRRRVWWKLFLGKSWATLYVEAGYPGCYAALEFATYPSAVDYIEEQQKRDAWTEPWYAVVNCDQDRNMS
jgi:hypothetical protein